MRDSLTLLIDDDDGAVCHFGPVVYVVWRARRSLATVAAADAAIEAMVERYGEGRRLLYVHRAPDRPGFQRSEVTVREAMMQHFERHDGRFLAAALAIEATGLGGSVLRSISAGVILLRRSQMKTRSFPDARDAVRWLSELGRDVSPFDADRMIEDLVAAGLCLPG